MNLRTKIRRLLIILTWCTLSFGCLIPGSIEERPITVGALSVDLALLTPASQEPILWFSRADGPFTFSVESATSLPEGIDGKFLWWVNYSSDNAQPIQFENPTFLFAPCSDGRFDGETNDLFTVSVIISDQDINLDKTFRNYPEGAATYAIDWNIGLVGTCP